MLSAGSRQPRLTAGLFFHAVLPPVLCFLAMTQTNITPELDGLLEDLEEAALDIQKRQRAELASHEAHLRARYDHRVLHHFVYKRRLQKFNITFEQARMILAENYHLIK